MNNQTNNILLLLSGMQNTRILQYNIKSWDTEIWNGQSEYQWGGFYFKYYVSVLERLEN